MERERLPLRLKLRVAASIDYPAASKILVSFPDKWELIHQMRREDRPLYIAAMPPSQEQPHCDRVLKSSTLGNLRLRVLCKYGIIEIEKWIHC